MVAVIVSVGDAGALGIVANGGEWGGKEQGKDSPGSGFNLGIRATKADKRVSKPRLGAFFHTGIAGVGFAFGIDGGFEVVEGKERVIVQAIGIINAVHCEVDIAGVGDGDGGVGKAFEAFDRLGFTFHPGVGTLAGLTGGGTGVEIADDGGQVKGIGEDEGIKRIQHFGYFLSSHAVFGRGFNRHQWPGRIHPTGQRR